MSEDLLASIKFEMSYPKEELTGMIDRIKQASDAQQAFGAVSEKAAKMLVNKEATAQMQEQIRGNQELMNVAKQQAETKLKYAAQLKTATKEQITSDQESMRLMGQASAAQLTYQKALKEVGNEIKFNEKITRAMSDANAYASKQFDAVAKGALTLKDAEAKLTQNAKAVAQEIMSLNKEIDKNGKATSEQTAKLKQLESALDTYKEAADEAGDAQLEFNRLMQNSDDRLSGNVKAIGMMTGALSGLGGTMGSIFGDGAAKMADFAGSASQAANQFGGMIDQMKAGKDMGGFQGGMMQATSAIGMFQAGLQIAMQVWDMFDGAIKKGEQTIIDAGKNATQTANQFKSYELGNKTLDDRIKLIDEVAKSDQKMASSLRGLAADSEAFDAKLKQVNKTLIETREKGMGKDWEVQQTGGGLLGWMKKLGTQTEEMAANMGKALVAIDEFRQGVSETGKDLAAGMAAAANYTGSVEQRINAMNITIAQNKGDVAEVQRLTIKGLQDERDQTIKLINEKIALTQQRQIDARVQASQVQSAVAAQQKIIDTMSKFRRDDSTQFIMDSVFKDVKDLGTFMTQFRGIIDNNIKYYDKEETYLKETVAELSNVFGNKFRVMVNASGLTLEEFFTNLVNGDTDIKNYITSMRTLLPALDEVKSGTKLYETALKDLHDQLDPKNYDGINQAFDRLIAKQKELWKSEDEKNAKGETEKPKSVALDKFAMPQLANMDKEVEYYVNLRKKVYEKLGNNFNFGIPYWKKSMDSETKKLAESIAKDNTLQDALKAQQTKLVDLEKQLPKLTGTARTEAERQIKEARSSITTLTEELNNALRNTASIRADIVLSAQEAVKDVANLDSMEAMQKQTADWQKEIDKIKAGYNDLSDAGKLAADTQIAAITSIITSVDEQVAALSASVRVAVDNAKKLNEGLEKSYQAAKEAWDAAHDNRTQAQRDEDAFQKKLADTTKYYDDQIKAFHDKGIFGTSDIKALEDMRDDAIELINDTHDLETATKAYNDQLKAAADLLKQIQDGANVAAKIHEEWLKKINPIQYEKDVVQATIDSMAITKKALLDAATSGNFSSDLTAVLYKIGFDANKLTGDMKKDTEMITSYFQQLSDEAWKNAGFIQDAQGVWRKLGVEVDETGKAIAKATQGLTSFNKELEDLKTKNASFKLDINMDDFVKSFDDALTGRQDSVLKKIQDSNKKALDALDETSNKSKQAVYSWWEAYQKEGLEKGFDSKAMLDKYGMNYAQMWELYSQKILDIDNQTAQKRLDIAQKNALDLAAAYKTEFDKLTQMQKSLDDMIAAHDQKTADARTEVAKYVTRQKLKEGDRQIYDQAQQLGEEYEKYRKAGMSEQDLAEWLALRKSELTKGENKDQLNQFDQFWKDRKALADKAADADKEAWDNQVNAAKTAINTQKELVDALKTSADAAKDSVIEMLKAIAGAAGVTVPNPAAGSTGSPVNNLVGNLSDTGVELPDGALYSQYKSKLSSGQRPSRNLLDMIGTYGIDDLVWHKTQQQWVPHYTNGQQAGQGSPSSGSSTSEKPAEFIPVETSKEIQDRIQGYKDLQQVATDCITAIRTLLAELDKAIQISFEALKPDTKDQWYKNMLGAWADAGKDMVKNFTKALHDEFDPVNGTGLVRKMEGWGENLANLLAIGLDSSTDKVSAAVVKLAQAIAKYLESHSPPEYGPLKTMDEWGYNLGQLYTQTFGQGLEDGLTYVDQGLALMGSTIQSKQSKITQTANYAGTNFGLTTAEGTTDIKALKDYRNWLLQSPEMVDLWGKRSQTYASKDSEFGAFRNLVNLESSKTTIDQQSSELAQTDTTKQVELFYKWFNKSLLNPDIGEISYDILKRKVDAHPELKIWTAFHDQLKQQYPEIYDEAVANGLITPTAYTTVTDQTTGEILGKKQTGAYFGKYQADYLETNFQGATGFNDWLQAKFNTWVKNNETMVDPTSKEAIGYGWYDVVASRDKFLEGWSNERLSDLVKEYQNYVTGLGTVKDYQAQLSDITAKYSDTEAMKKLASGSTISDVIYNSDYAKALLTGSQYSDYADKLVKTGGAFYDKSGNEVADASMLSGGGSPVSQEAWSKLIGSKINSPIGDQDPAIMKFRAGVSKAFGGEGWNWGWFRQADGTPVQLPFAVIKVTDAAQLKQDGYNISPMTEPEAIERFGQEAVKRFKEQGVWPFILVSADKGGGEQVGNFSDIEKSVNDAMQKLRAENEKLAKDLEARGTTNPSEGDTLGDLVYKNKYTTVKGNYSAGYNQLQTMLSGLNSDTKKLILDRVIANIDNQYKDTQSTYEMGVTGASGDGVPLKGNAYTDNSGIRNAMKTQLARALGFDNEYSTARGWRNALDTDATKVAQEEVMKLIEGVSDGIINLSQTTKETTTTNSEAVTKTTDYLKGLIDNGGLNEDTFKQVQTALSQALQLGYIDKNEAAQIVQSIIPDAAKQTQFIGLTSFRGGTTAIGDYDYAQAILESAWGPYAPRYSLAGHRQFLTSAYTNTDTLLQMQYANPYLTRDNYLNYYPTNVPNPGYIQGTPWGYQTPEVAAMGQMPQPGMPSGYMSPFGSGNLNNYVYDSPSNTFANGNSNTFNFSINIQKMYVQDGTDFGEKLSDDIIGKLGLLGASI